MVVEARLRIRHRGCWTERLTHEHVTIMGGDRQHIIAVMHGNSPEEVDAYLVSRVHDQDNPVVVDRTPTSVVLRCCPPETGVISAIFSYGCTVMWPAVYKAGEETYTVLAPSRARLDGMVDRLKDLGEVTLEKLTTVSADAIDVSVALSDLTHDLTEKQVASLRLAIAHGYYESPRRTDLEALARAFGVSRSTLQEHLRKAEERVLQKFASVLASHPALERAPRRRVGRPAKARA